MYLLFFLSIKEQVINSLRPVSHPDPSRIRLGGSGWLRLDIRPDCTFQQGVTNSINILYFTITPRWNIRPLGRCTINPTVARALYHALCTREDAIFLWRNRGSITSGWMRGYLARVSGFVSWNEAWKRCAKITYLYGLSTHSVDLWVGERMILVRYRWLLVNLVLYLIFHCDSPCWLVNRCQASSRSHYVYLISNLGIQYQPLTHCHNQL